MKRLLLFTFFVFLCSSDVPAGAGILEVPWEYSTIQGAIDAASDGDVVVVHPGTYYETEIDFRGKEITVRSIHPQNPDVVDATIVDAQRTGSVFRFSSDEDSNSILRGLTIRNGGKEYGGGGIVCWYASPRIESCQIRDNYSEQSGGGLYVVEGSPEIISCQFEKNGAGWSGGGAFFDSGQGKVVRCRFEENEAAYGGGGIFVAHSSEATVSNSTFTGNSANYGGGMGIGAYTTTIENCVVVKNIALDSRSGGIFIGHDITARNTVVAENGGGGIDCWGGSPNLVNFIVRGNSPEQMVFKYEANPGVSFSNIEGGVPWWARDNGGNIDVDPMFTSFQGHDYVLAASSPCIDKGDPALEDGIDWPEWYKNGSRSDMGAYGGPGNVGWLKK